MKQVETCGRIKSVYAEKIQNRETFEKIAVEYNVSGSSLDSNRSKPYKTKRSFHPFGSLQRNEVHS